MHRQTKTQFSSVKVYPEFNGATPAGSRGLPAAAGGSRSPRDSATRVIR